MLLAWIIGTLLYITVIVIIGIIVIIATIRQGFKNKEVGKCFFHDWRRTKVFEDGAYWYFECPKCHCRDALKAHRGYSPVDFNWLNGGRRASVSPNPPADDPRFGTKFMYEGRPPAKS